MYRGAAGYEIPADPESDCLMAYSGPELGPVFSLEVTDTMFLHGTHNGMIKGFFLEDPVTACELATHQGAVKGLVACGQTLHSCSLDGTVKTWDLDEKEELISRDVGEGTGVGCLAVRDGMVYAGTEGGVLSLWGAREAQNEPVQRMRAHVGSITALEVQDMSKVFTVSSDGLAKHIDVNTGKLLAVYEGCGPLHSCLLDEEHTALYVGGSVRNVLMYDVRCAVCVGQFRGHSDAVSSLALSKAQLGQSVVLGAADAPAVPASPPTATLYSASDDKTVVQWNIATRKAEYTFAGHAAAVSCMKFTHTGELYTGSYDGSVRVWDTQAAHSSVQAKLLQEAEQALLDSHDLRESSGKSKSSKKKSKSKDRKRKKK